MDIDKIAKDMIAEIMTDFEPKPDDPNSKSKCSKCIGYECGCMIAGKRNPSQECGAFHDKHIPIIIKT